MKKLLLSAAALAFLFTSCKKDDDNNNNSGGATWKLGTTNYTASAVSDTTFPGSLVAVASNGGLWVNFNGTTIPTTAGSYKIVGLADSAMEIDVTAVINNGGMGTFYDTKDGSGVMATVTMSGNKIKVTIPEVWVYNQVNDDDSMKLSGTITQK